VVNIPKRTVSAHEILVRYDWVSKSNMHGSTCTLYIKTFALAEVESVRSKPRSGDLRLELNMMDIKVSSHLHLVAQTEKM
jgi:hypothetical protein